MTIDSFPPELAAFVQGEVALGKYPSETAVMVAAVRLLREQEEQEEFLRREIQAGIDQMERGEFTTYDAASLGSFAEEIKAKGRRLLAARESGNQ